MRAYPAYRSLLSNRLLASSNQDSSSPEPTTTTTTAKTRPTTSVCPPHPPPHPSTTHHPPRRSRTASPTSEECQSNSFPSTACTPTPIQYPQLGTIILPILPRHTHLPPVPRTTTHYAPHTSPQPATCFFPLRRECLRRIPLIIPLPPSRDRRVLIRCVASQLALNPSAACTSLVGRHVCTSRAKPWHKIMGCDMIRQGNGKYHVDI